MQDTVRAADPTQGRVYNCRFHPVNWWHEVGCPHMTWTAEQLADAEKVRDEGKVLRGIVLRDGFKFPFI